MKLRTFFTDKVKSQYRAFTLVEIIVGVAVFLIVATAAYGTYTGLFKIARLNQTKLLAIALADEQFEIVRNMPYANVGLTNGIPQGVLPQTQTLVRGGTTFTVGLTVRNLDLSTSTYQVSSKLVEVSISCASCQNFTPITLTGQVSPANLQSASNGGALTVQVLDSSGNPVPGASVDIQSTATSSIQDHDVTNDAGLLDVVGVPQGLNVYDIQVSKTGYSSERTYAAGSVYTGGAVNSNPSKPDATVLNQQLTQNTFSIDLLSSLHISSVTPTCSPVGNVHFNLVGSKTVGTTALGIAIPKYSQSLVTNGSGVLDLGSMEWDTYSLTPTDSSYDVAGVTPLSPFGLNPNNSQNVQIIVVPKNSNSLMVTVTDSATGLPLSGASVHLSGSGVDQTYLTGQGYINQADWSNGSGQSFFTDTSKYYSDDANVDTSLAGNVKLRSSFGAYPAQGQIESSTFDTGSASNFFTLSWSPASQPANTGPNSLKFQLASNSILTATTTWNYVGPDGTGGSYYTVTDSPIAAIHSGDRYLRYFATLSTAVATATPTLSGVSFTYTSSCTPPGQVLFNSLAAGNYSLSVSKSGYTAWSGTVTVGSGWQNQTVPLGP